MTSPSPAPPYLRWWRLSSDRTYLYAGTSRINYGGTTPPNPAAGKLTRVRMRSVFTPVSPPPDRSSLVAGVDKPDATNTGVFAGSTLTAQNTSITYGNINPAGSPQIVQNMEFFERVVVNGQYITFRNCRFWGPNGPTPKEAITVTNANCVGIRFEDCDITQQNPIWDSLGVKGWQFTLLRCHIWGVTDGIQHIGQGSNYTGLDQNVTMQQCFLEKFAYMAPDPGAAGGLTDNASHLDGFQIRGGRNFLFWGNNIQSFFDPTIGQGGVAPVTLPSGTRVTGNRYAPSEAATSCGMFSPILGLFGNLQIRDNWMDGGAYMLNFNPAITSVDTGGAGGVGIRITGNRVGYNARSGSSAFIIAPTTLSSLGSPSWVVSGNIREDTGASANFVQRG